MLHRNTRFLTIAVMLGTTLLFACSSAPSLVSRNGAVPDSVDLSGLWSVRTAPGAKQSSDLGRDRGIVIPKRGVRRAQRRRNSNGVSAQVFLEFGELLKITQTRFGLFISYDRSVVEEYTFGENRLVTIGPIEARRVSGWEKRKFIVETLDDSGTILVEVWHLEKNGAVLIRNIRISKGDKVSFTRRQVFDRK